MGHKAVPLLLMLAGLVPAHLRAQAEAITTPPPNLVIGNYNSAPVGSYGGLEGTAFAARIDDPSATWFNPAGLARQAAPQISGSAGVYQRTVVAPQALPNQGGSIQQLPNFVGFTFVPHENLTAGAAFLSSNAWNQETDSELFSSTASEQQRFAYSADSDFEQRVAAAGLGYRGPGPFRLGAGFAFTMMNLRLVQSVSDRIANGSGLRTLEVSARASGSAFQLRWQGGAQYEKGNWQFGGAVRSPGLMLHKSGSVILDGVVAGRPGSLGASIFDPDAGLAYHLPWEFHGGGAFVRPRLEVEVDLQAYTAIGAYPLISSSQPVMVYGDNGSGAPRVTSSPYSGMTSASRGIVNVSAGGHVRVFKERDLLVHAAVASNRSPVADGDTVFTKIDLTIWSVGVSGTLGKFQFTLGSNRQIGSGADIALRNLLNGQVVHTPIEVRMSGFVYSLAYKF